jgi:hypothetical protein
MYVIYYFEVMLNLNMIHVMFCFLKLICDFYVLTVVFINGL